MALFWWRLKIWIMRGGAVLFLVETDFFQIHLGLGWGTNNFAELLTLKLLLTFARERNCAHIQIFGDSMLVINWINKVQICHNVFLADFGKVWLIPLSSCLQGTKYNCGSALQNGPKCHNPEFWQKFKFFNVT